MASIHTLLCIRVYQLLTITIHTYLPVWSISLVEKNSTTLSINSCILRISTLLDSEDQDDRFQKTQNRGNPSKNEKVVTKFHVETNLRVCNVQVRVEFDEGREFCACANNEKDSGQGREDGTQNGAPASTSKPKR